MQRLLSHEEARRFYDWFGSKQDLQRIYEDPAVDALLAHADFEHASAVVELGCGTGRLAERLLRERLPPHATYAGFDISSTMIETAQARLEPWAGRARALPTAGSPCLPVADAACDRFLSTYVLDLFSEDDIRAALQDARRVLVPGGRLCLASLTFGTTRSSRALCGLWTTLHARRPQLVGGCRPVRLERFLGPDWKILHREVICTFGICTEVLIAS